ncbi:MAG: S9 family peptidase [Chloroflexota bacterium]
MGTEDYLDALLSLPALADWPQVSRDGRWVAWTWLRVAPVADVWVAPTDGTAPPLRLTETSENTFLVSWMPDSRAVIVEQDVSGNERAQLFRVELSRPGKMTPLTEPDPGYFLRGGQLHPDGRRLVYGANYDFARQEVLEPTWIYCHDLETGTRQVLARPVRGSWVSPQLAPQGTHVLYTRQDRHPGGRQGWLVDIEGLDDREILNFGDKCRVQAPTWLPDGRRILFIAEDGNERRLGLFDLASEQITWLIDDQERAHFIEDAWVPFGSASAVVAEVRDTRFRAFLLHVDTAKEMPFPVATGNFLPLAPAAGDGSQWIGVHYSSRQPHDIVRFALKRGGTATFRSLSRVWERTGLRPESLTEAEDFRWRSSDGVEVQGWLYRAAGEPLGTVVLIHGGPTSHSSDRIHALVQYLARRQFHVLEPNYRGSTGFGIAFQELIKQDGWGGLEQEDIKSGIETLIERGIARPARVGVAGTSYGGYSSWCQITRHPREVIAAAAPVCGMTDLVIDYQTTRPDLRPYSEEMMGGSPQQVPEKYRDRSPIHFVQDIQGSLLIVQGAQDPNVTPENVRAVRTALDRASVRYELLEFEDEGHGIMRRENLRTLYVRMADFFARAFAQQ